MEGGYQLGPRFRRIALVGLGASGKTCALAALAMPRLSHPQGLSAVWLAGHENPDGALAGSQALAGGVASLRRAIKLIEKGSLPARTAIDEIGSGLRYVFSAPSSDAAGASARSIDFPVEVFDYSGNSLISPRADQQLSESLTERLRAAEGFVVLADVPVEFPESERRRLLRAKLVERIREDIRGKPVAVLLTQWDRLQSLRDPRPKFGFDGSGTAPARLVVDPAGEARQWLSTPDAGDLGEFIAALEQLAGPGNLAVFAVSSLGEVVVRSDVYRRAEDRVYRISTAGNDARGAAAEPILPSRIIYESPDGRRFNVDKLDEQERTIEFREISGMKRTILFAEGDALHSSERRVNWPLESGKPTLASFGLEDAFVWLARRCDQSAVERIEQRLSKIGIFAFQNSLLPAKAARVGDGEGGSRGTRSGRISTMAAIIEDSLSLSAGLPEGGRDRAKMGALIERAKTIRIRQIGLALILGLTTLAGLGLGIESLLDASWASGVKDRARRPETVEVAVQVRDAHDISAYLTTPFRYMVSHLIVWSPDDARVTLDQLTRTLDRRLYGAIETAAHRELRSFLDPVQRSKLAEDIDAYLRISPRGAMRPAVENIRRQLVDLEQTVTITSVEFRASSPQYLGSEQATAYVMTLLIDNSPPPIQHIQYKRINLQSSVPAFLESAKLSVTRKIQGSLLRPMELQLCYWEKLTAAGGADGSKPECVVANVDLVDVARTGMAAVGPVGPLKATIGVEWQSGPPDVPAYHN